jgi:hypothetical protein
MTITGINSNVSQIDGTDIKKVHVTVAPTATPKMVRIPSPNSLTVRNCIPQSAAIKQLAIGPNNHGKGSASQRKISAPVRLIKWV